MFDKPLAHDFIYSNKARVRCQLQARKEDVSKTDVMADKKSASSSNCFLTFWTRLTCLTVYC